MTLPYSQQSTLLLSGFHPGTSGGPLSSVPVHNGVGVQVIKCQHDRSYVEPSCLKRKACPWLKKLPSRGVLHQHVQSFTVLVGRVPAGDGGNMPLPLPQESSAWSFPLNGWMDERMDGWMDQSGMYVVGLMLFFPFTNDGSVTIIIWCRAKGNAGDSLEEVVLTGR
jgi:hypothetical protein